jgi:DhnA family fructose-bisphosphate aldolase class Ia
MAEAVVNAGGAGVTFGRNVWQSPDVEGTIAALKVIVHADASMTPAHEESVAGA